MLGVSRTYGTKTAERNNKAVGIFLRRYGRDVFSLVAILGCSLALSYDAILNAWVYYEFDTSLYYYPVLSWANSAIDRGGVDLWSPAIYGGFPLFADGESGQLYLPNRLLLTILDPHQLLIWSTVLHQFLAGTFMYLFLRVWQPNRLPALVGALTLAFGSFFVAQMHHVNVFDCATWLPAVLLCAELAVRGKGWRRVMFVAVGGLAFGTQLLTIHIQPILMTVLALALYLLFRFVCYGQDRLYLRIGKAVAVGLGIAFIGLALGAVQLLPLSELAMNAVRGEGSSYDFAASFGVAMPNLATLFFPYFFRFQGYEYWMLWFRWETMIYVGIVPLLLSTIAVALYRTKETVFFALLGVFSVLLALGDYSPIKLFWLLGQLPGFSVARAPGRFSLLFVLSVAVLACFGFYHLQKRLDQTRKERSLRSMWVWLTATAAFGLGIFALTQAGRAWMLANKQAALDLISNSYLTLRHQEEYVYSAEKIYNAVVTTLSWHNGRTMMSFIFFFGLLFVLVAWMRFGTGARLWQGILVALVAVDLLAFGLIFHPKMQVDELGTATGAVQFISQNQGLYRTYTPVTLGTTVPNLTLPLGIETVGGYSSLNTRRFEDFSALLKTGNGTLLDLWNVRYVVYPKGTPPAGSVVDYRPVYENSKEVVYENPNCLPRAYFVQEGAVASSPSEALSLMTGSDFDPTTTVVLEMEDGQTVPPSDQSKVGGKRNTDVTMVNEGNVSPANNVKATSYDSASVSIQVEADRDGYLVLSDSYYPGWDVTVNGASSTIYRANYLFRAVHVSKGTNTVMFHYDPLSFKVGAIISVLGIVLFFLVVGVSVWKGRKKGRLAGQLSNLSSGGETIL